MLEVLVSTFLIWEINFKFPNFFAPSPPVGCGTLGPPVPPVVLPAPLRPPNLIQQQAMGGPFFLVAQTLKNLEEVESVEIYPYLSMKNADSTTQKLDFTMKHGDFTTKRGD
jgi:hypothetical protein